MQGLDEDALSQLMQSVSLHTQTSAEPSESSTSAQTAPQEGTPGHHSPNEGMSTQRGPNLGQGMAGQSLLADCPLPFEETCRGAVSSTPARARRPAKRRAMTDDTSDNESRVSSVCSATAACNEC